ncbi:ribonuclease P protein component [Kocuria tytonicola]|uniref:Ribonuclease P protein component n=1 Tax=Kocuria tytonicola TaxID=2055946 RepID=A0A3L9L5I2_9MICC|nr:ribonuclease P protein component [Kocuria tytonicola]RLY93925.1 ribonuclease P protein component [Kocuria tytonicola]RLZ03810.1 ribonuclease P protein component [Kocuria tytonicola]
MLPTRHRMRTSAQFSTTVRSGARSGRRNVVVSVRGGTGEPSRVGFVVSKAVGNAVTRNKVKRRLRELSAQTVRERPHGVDLVVRALPPAAAASWEELGRDYRSALDTALRRVR